MPNLAAKFWEERVEFFKYFIVGISGFLLDVGSLFVLKEYLGLRPVVAVIINQPFIVVGMFYFYKKWSFKADGVTNKQFVRFVVVSAANYLISALWIYAFHDKMGMHYILARIFNIILAVSWNFVIYKFWVYRAEKPVETPEKALNS